MKLTLIVGMCLVSGAAVLLGQPQPPAKEQSSATAQPASTVAPSNEDLNIRAYIELLRSDLRKRKSDIVGVVMDLDAQESAEFWPIYRDFEADYTRIGDGIVDLVNRYVQAYDGMTPEIADELANKLLNLEQQRIDLKRKYYERLKTAMDAITAARFLQVENQLEKIADLQIAAQLPVISRTTVQGSAR